MMAGFMALDGWHDYTCRDKLHHAFWEEFSSACTEYGDSSIRWREAHKVAQLAAKLGAIHYAFQRSAVGYPSGQIATPDDYFRLPHNIHQLDTPALRRDLDS